MAVYDPPLEMLDQALESILNQTFTDFEFLIVDDGSGDPGVGSRLSRRAQRDARIRIVAEPHRGLTASLNRGLALARGTWIARQDADDWSEPARLERQIEYFRAHPETTVLGIQCLDASAGRAAVMATAFADETRRYPAPVAARESVRARVGDVSAGGGGFRGRISRGVPLLAGLRFSVAAGRTRQRRESGGTAVSLSLHQRLGERRPGGGTSAGAPGDPASGSSAAARRAGRCRTARSRRRRDARSLGALLKQADHLMLAGDYRQAWAAYAKLLGSHPRNPLAWAKLARLGVFRTIPRLREACFR